MINSSACAISKPVRFPGAHERELLLEGEIGGVETCYVETGIGREHRFKPEAGKLNILIFLGGEGAVSYADMRIAVPEPALFVPGPAQGYSVRGGEQQLSYLELVLDLTKQDQLDLQRNVQRFPYHVLFSRCGRYSEAIKSEKTINRMVLPEGIVPRVCAGTVETIGPDEVAPHTHPMLEQLFLGLEGNDVCVFADADEKGFGENELLHIPLGSTHGVKVEAGKRLHYLWVDIFSDHSQMAYMQENHRMIDE